MCNTDIPIPELSKLTGIPTRSIYQIYYHCIYSEITKDMNFIHRDRLSSKRKSCKLSEVEVQDIIKLLLDGELRCLIADKYNVGNSTIDDIYFHRTWERLTNGIEFPTTNRNKYKFKTKPLIQYDLNMNFIAEYNSARDAEKETGIGYKLISRVCRGERDCTCGYIFKFKENEILKKE